MSASERRGAASARARASAWRVGLSVLSGLTIGLAQAQAQVTVRDDRGLSQQFDRPPERIVSLLPSLTESVCALGACALLVGTDRFSNSPASVDALPKLGGLEDTAIERLISLRPDLVLVAKSARVIERLEALGLRVLALESQNHADVHNTLTVLGRVLGRTVQADAAWKSIEQELQDAATRLPARWRGQQVYFEVGSAPYAAGAGSFIGQTLSRLGLGNIVPVAMGPFPKLNPEFVVRAQPQIVMASQRELDRMAERPGWTQMRALRQRQVCGFEPARYEMLIRPGPRMGQAASVIVDCLVQMAAP